MANTYETVIVQSHSADVIGYNRETQVLRIIFRNSSEGYDYQNVTVDQWESLLESASVGSWIASNIRFNPQTYPYTRLSPRVTNLYLREVMRQAANARLQIESA